MLTKSQVSAADDDQGDEAKHVVLTILLLPLSLFMVLQHNPTT